MGSYVVKRGDTLTGIAREYNTTVDKLAKLNNIKNVDIIHTGQVLTLPETPDEELGKQFRKCIKDVENMDSFRKLLSML